MREIQIRRIDGNQVVVLEVISGGGDEEYSVLLQGRNGVDQRLGEKIPSIAVVGRNDIHAVVFQHFDVIEAGHCIAHPGASVTGDELTSKELDVPVHTRDAQRVVAGRADNPCHVRAMAEVVHGVATGGQGIEAVSSDGATDVHSVYCL